MTILTEHMSSASCEPEQREGADAPSQAEPSARSIAERSEAGINQKAPGEGIASSKLKNWQTLVGLLIGYAQTLVRLERVNDARAWQVAGELEISARSSLALCMQDIHALHAGDPPSTEEEQDAFERLHAIASGLLALSYFIREIKRRLAGRGVAGRINESAVARPFESEVSCYPSPVYEIPVLDPGWLRRGSVHPEHPASKIGERRKSNYGFRSRPSFHSSRTHPERSRRMMAWSARALSFDVAQDEREPMNLR